MFNNTYELTRKQNKYKSMKENVTKMFNVLSNSDAIDNLTMVQTGLKNYYLVNSSPCKYNEIKIQKERISSCLIALRNILNKIDSKLDNIKDDITAAEANENGEI